MATIDTDDLFQIASDLADERAATLAKQKANRDMLRNLADMGVLKKGELTLLEEYYPTRTRGGAEEEAEEAAAEEEVA
jgi:hypothetical protein